MQLARRGVKFVRYSLSGKVSGVHAAGIDYVQNQSLEPISLGKEVGTDRGSIVDPVPV